MQTPIRRRLMSMILLTSGIVLLVSMAATFTYEFFAYRQAALGNLTTLGRIVATNSTAALAFQNPEDARSILGALKAEPHVVAAALYDRDDRPFVSWNRSAGTSENLPARPGDAGFRFAKGSLSGFQPVYENERHLGTLYLQSDMGAIYAQLRAQLLIALVVLAASGLIAYLLSHRMQQLISRPILALAQTAQAISDQHNYAVRAPRTQGYELNILTDAFNHMLDQIQDQHGRLNTQLGNLHLLQNITRAIGERQDTPSVFRVVLQNLEDSLPVQFACIGLYEAAESELTVVSVGAKSAALAASLDMPEQARVPIGANGLARCVSGELVYEPDVLEHGAPFPQRFARVGLRSLTIAPLMVENRVFGVLIAARHAPQAFASADCEFLRQLSEHVALASHQAQLYDALQRAYEDLRQTQHTVMQQERLRALGQMASGIAHDINNALSPVSLYTESLLEREPNLSDRARGYLTTIQRAIDDVAGTVARMREFYRPREAQLVLAQIDINRIVEQTIDLTHARWSDLPQQRGAVVDLKRDLAEGLPRIMGAEGEIRDALTNLIFNAVDAMAEGGTLALRTRLIPPENDGPMAGVSAICVEVSDTGIGMDEETRRRCLEPFFTTKGERGTGLGLAMVYGMVQRHSAALEIDSELGRGTTFRLIFPAYEAALTATTRLPALTLARRLRILLVDDDPLLIKSLQDTLEGDGHLITASHGGQAGIDVFLAAQRSKEPMDLVITDLGMPYVDGRKVAAAIKGASARTPVVLLTGWGQRLVADNDIPAHVDRVLSKPPRLHELRATLAELTAEAL